jgi:surface antigen
VLLAFTTPLLADNPFVGTWTHNAAKSKYTTGSAPTNVTIVIEEQGANLQVTVTGTTSDGTPISVKYTVPIAGGAGTVQAGDFDAISAKQISANVRENTYTKGGKEIRTRRMTVSKDGKTMSLTFKGTGPDGKPAAGTDVYDKQ